MGIQLLFPLKGHYPPQFSAHVRCGQMAGWTEMRLGMEVGIGSGDFVLEGTQLPPKKAQPHPIFGPCLLCPNGWMDGDDALYGSRSRPRPYCVRRGPTPPRMGHSSPPLFSEHIYCGHGRPSQLLLSSCYH